MLRMLSPIEQHGVALGFILKEQGDTAASTTTTASSGTTPRVDTTIAAHSSSTNRRRLRSPCHALADEARSWAYGCRLTDATCFGTYAEFKEELRQAFEPPKNEFRSRAEFLDLQQGKHDVHAYAQRARYLVSNIVTNPMDEATKGRHVYEGIEGWSRQDLSLPRAPKYSRSCDHSCHVKGI
ncbi:hypothetical protein C6341_g16743 [Phytophthora cactorum]|nr:hypothetical protein C6341_g16743 [Phytophthora cactorum]